MRHLDPTTLMGDPTRMDSAQVALYNRVFGRRDALQNQVTTALPPNSDQSILFDRAFRLRESRPPQFAEDEMQAVLRARAFRHAPAAGLAGGDASGVLQNLTINKIAGVNFSVSATSKNFLLADGTKFNSVPMGGDVTITDTLGTSAIGTNKVTNVMLAQMATVTIKGNNTGGTANALDLTVAQVNAMLGTPALAYANNTIPAGNTVANTTTATLFTSSVTIAANSLAVGDVIFIEAWGVYGTDVAAPTLTLAVRLAGSTLVTTGVVTMIASMTNKGWNLRAQAHVAAIGAGGSMECQGLAEMSTAATTALMINASNTAVVAVDTTAANTLRVRATWGTANANNTITLRNYSVRVERPLSTT